MPGVGVMRNASGIEWETRVQGKKICELHSAAFREGLFFGTVVEFRLDHRR